MVKNVKKKKSNKLKKLLNNERILFICWLHHIIFVIVITFSFKCFIKSHYFMKVLFSMKDFSKFFPEKILDFFLLI